MNRRKRRKHSRRYNGVSNTAKNSITSIVIVICISVAAGYMTATYLISPMLGLDTSPLVFNSKSDAENDENKTDDSAVLEDEIDKEPDETEGLAESGFVLQYGSFSSEEAARNRVEDLKLSGIEAEIIEKDGAYKVISPLFDTEAEARTKLEKQKNIVDVFITRI